MKNHFYLFILFASLAVCGVVMFRPQTAEHVLGLLGLQDKSSSSHVASDWDDMSAKMPSSENDASAFGNALSLDNASYGDTSDGFAVASPLQPVPQMQTPMLSYTPVYDTGVPDEGFAVSGAGNGTTPDFASFPAVPFGSQSPSFEGYSPGVANDEPPPTTSDIAIHFGSPAGSANPTAPTAYESNPGTMWQPSPPNQAFNDNAIGFANFTMPPQSDAQHFAVPSVMSFGDNTPMTDASVVMPDPQYGGGFGDYRSSMTSSELDARIIPLADAPAITWGPPSNPPAGRITQPIMTPEQLTSANTVVPVQGVTVQTVPPAETTQQTPQPTGTPQFQTPAFETPSSVSLIRETPLYIPPSGGYAQQTQPLPQMMQQPPPVTSQPLAPSVPQVTQSQSQQAPSQSESPSTVTIAGAAQRDLPVTDMRAQYEPGYITETETVFATDMLARVGAHNVIMTCDILAELREVIDNEWVVQYRKVFEEHGQQPSVMEERNYKAEGMQVLFERTLDNWIMLQMLYVDMTLNLPAEQIEKFKEAESKNFDAEIIPKMMEQYGVTNRYDLDMELRKYGTTLDRQKTSIIQKHLAQGWFSEIAKQQKSMPTFDDMVGYYEEHKDEKYKILGQAKWEELAVLFSETASVQEAYAKIAELGNRVQKGEAFADVARQGSQGLTAYRGGEREATVGSLKTKTLENAVFSLPLGKMSTIIKEETGGSNAGFYIVCVTKRRDTHYTPFDQVQGEIHKSILEERFLKEQERVFSDIRKRIPVIKTNNLQQIIAMASEAELNAPIEDTPQRHARLIAKAERLDPTKKDGNVRKGREQMVAKSDASAQSPSGAETQSAQQGIRMASAHKPSGDTVMRVSPAQEEPPKKKTFLQSLNPFK